MGFFTMINEATVLHFYILSLPLIGVWTLAGCFLFEWISEKKERREGNNSKT